MSSSIAFDCLNLNALVKIRFTSRFTSWPLHNSVGGTGLTQHSPAWIRDGDLLIVVEKVEDTDTHFVKYLTLSRYGLLWIMCHQGSVMPHISFETLG